MLVACDKRKINFFSPIFIHGISCWILQDAISTFLMRQVAIENVVIRTIIQLRLCDANSKPDAHLIHSEFRIFVQHKIQTEWNVSAYQFIFGVCFRFFFFVFFFQSSVHLAKFDNKRWVLPLYNEEFKWWQKKYPIYSDRASPSALTFYLNDKIIATLAALKNVLTFSCKLV